MARKINWGPTNELMQRWTQYMMQDKLAKNRSDRSMGYLEEQMAGYERIDILQNEMRKELQNEKNNLDRELAILKTQLDASQDASADSFKKQAQAYEVTGNQELAQKSWARYEEAIKPLAVQNVKILQEEGLDAPGVVDILKAMPINEARQLLQSHAVGLRAKESRGLAEKELGEKTAQRFATTKAGEEQRAISQQTADVAKGNLALKQRAQGIESLIGAIAGGEEGAKIKKRDIELPPEEEVAPELTVEPEVTQPLETELTPEESVNVLAGMIMEKAKAAGIPMSLEAATIEAKRLIGLR